MMHPDDELRLMDDVQDQAEKRECCCLPCDPVFEITDPGREGIDGRSADGWTETASMSVETAVDDIDDTVSNIEEDLF